MDCRIPYKMALAAILCVAPVVASAKCSATAGSDAGSYRKAYLKVSALAQFKAWPGHANAVFGAHADKQSVVKRKCYWSVTVYSNEGSHLSLWKSYLVPLGQGPILVLGADGEPEPLRPEGATGKEAR